MSILTTLLSTQTKRVLGRRDARHIASKTANDPTKQHKTKESSEDGVKHIEQAPSHMYFQHNEALVPPYNIILDTNFFTHTIRNKLDIMDGLMDALLAKVNPFVTDCTIAELEKLPPGKFRLALRLAKDERWQRLTCSHAGTYADDCIVSTCTKNRIYLVGTNDAPLKRRLRAIPGVPLVSVGRGKYTVEKLPNATF